MKIRTKITRKIRTIRAPVDGANDKRNTINTLIIDLSAKLANNSNQVNGT